MSRYDDTHASDGGDGGEHADLVALVRGELSTAEVAAADDHVGRCAECRGQLRDTVVAHALLARAGRTLGGAVAAPTTPTSTTPLPPLRRPAAAAPRRLLAAALAAAVVVALVAGTTAWLRTHDDGGTPRESVVAAALEPVDGAGGAGEVRMRESDGRTRLSVRVDGLAPTNASDYYYAWLLDPATNKMLPLGQVDARRGATFDLDDALVDSYSAVDLSLEADDGDPAHSVTSVLRGSYQPDLLTSRGETP